MLRTASEKTSEQTAKKALPYFLTFTVLLLIAPVFAGDKGKDEETLQQANVVLQAMLSDKNISQTSLANAKCVMILPGVKKFGFGVGGSGGRGPMLCRGGTGTRRCGRIRAHLGLSV